MCSRLQSCYNYFLLRPLKRQQQRMTTKAMMMRAPITIARISHLATRATADLHFPSSPHFLEIHISSRVHFSLFINGSMHQPDSFEHQSVNLQSLSTVHVELSARTTAGNAKVTVKQHAKNANLIPLFIFVVRKLCYSFLLSNFSMHLGRTVEFMSQVNFCYGPLLCSKCPKGPTYSLFQAVVFVYRRPQFNTTKILNI